MEATVSFVVISLLLLLTICKDYQFLLVRSFTVRNPDFSFISCIVYWFATQGEFNKIKTHAQSSIVGIKRLFSDKDHSVTRMVERIRAEGTKRSLCKRDGDIQENIA